VRIHANTSPATLAFMSSFVLNGVVVGCCVCVGVVDVMAELGISGIMGLAGQE